jgi:sulfite exporter TauE/SafE
MPDLLQLLSAALVGLLGAVHCVGMCGGIVGALAFTLPPEVRGSLARMLPFLLAYNAGRISSYVLAGAAFGGLGAAAVGGLGGLKTAEATLSVLAGLFMVALGLYLAGRWRALAHLEQLGGHLWRRLEPLGRRLLPVRSGRDAWLLGLVWGWLPCGLVYSVLVWSLAAGSAAGGALLMASFGLGTLPTLLTLGAAAARLTPVLQRPAVRAVAGALVVAFGVVQIWRGLAGI